MKRPHLSLLVVWLLVSAAAFAQPVTIDDARADVARGDYRGALQKIATILSSSREGPSASDRYDLLMLRAECQLQLQDRRGSIATFRSAAHVAGDIKQLAAAKANALVIDRSPGGTFRLPGSNEPPIDILPIESRKLAMTRMQQDLWDRNAHDIEQALRSESLPPIEDVFSALTDAYFLEMATTGDAKQTGPAMRDLGARAYQLMQAEVMRTARAVDQTSQLANSAVTFGWLAGPRGLHTADRDQLALQIDHLAQIQARARDYREVAARLGGDHQKWDALVADTTDALAAAQALNNQF